MLIAIALGVPACCLGIALAIYSSLKAAKIRDFVVKNALAPDLTNAYYLARFKFSGVCAAYEKATGDRASVRIVYLTGVLGALCFLGGVVLVSVNLPT